MSGGIYEFDGNKYYGDGREVDPLPQVCLKCGGKRFLNADGSYCNAYKGSDSDPVIPCPECAAERRAEGSAKK